MLIKKMSEMWGPIISSGEEDDENDPIVMLTQKYEDLKNSQLSFKLDETIEEATERRRHELFIIDKEIWDIIYKKSRKDL
jgi:hypothetical protein